MYRVLLTLVFAAALAGCIRLQMPDDMVTDAIDAIKDSDDEADSNDDRVTFSHSIVGAADTEQSDLKQMCLSELELRTTELLNVDSSAFTVVSASIRITGDKAIASCTVSLS